MKNPALVVLVAALALVSTTGCRKAKEKLAQKAAEKALSAGGVDVDLGSSGGGTTTIRDPKGGGVVQIGTGAKLPDGWPSDVPSYPGATVRTAVKTPEGMQTVMTTKDDPSKVMGFYKGKLPGKVQGEMDMGEVKTIAMKDTSRDITATVSSGSDGETTIMLVVATKKN